jgi:predicted transcriptional regulator
MALRAKVLRYIERKPSDFPTLLNDLDFRLDILARELSNLLQAGYITMRKDIYYLTDRGRQYLKIEKGGY